MFCIGINYKLAPVEVREKIAFSEDEKQRFIKDNMVILSTCIRVEIYFTDYSINSIAKEICKFKNIDYNSFKGYINIYSGDAAIKHLYRVAVGLESKILGEDEILGQVKEAYYFSHKNVKLSYEINTAFKGAVTSAKKIKTETLMSKSSVSIGTLVSGFINSNNIKKVMIIGISGKIGYITAKNILSYNNIKIIATERFYKKDFTHIKNVIYIPFSERYKYINECDAVISVTTSPHYTLTSEQIKKYNIKNKIFIDLAVPRDIDEDISDNSLFNIDYFETISKNNSEIKINEKEKAENIIENMIDDLKKEMFFHTIAQDLQKFNNCSFEQLIYKVRDGMTCAEFEKFIDIIKE